MPPAAPAHERRNRLAPLLLAMAVGGCLVVLVVAGVGLAGGLEEVGAEELPQFAVEEKIEGEPWNVTVIDAALFAGDALEPTTRTDSGNHWLVVLAEVEITADHTFQNIHTALAVPGVDGVLDDGFDPPRPQLAQVWRTRDSSRVRYLDPGLPERVLFLWERSGDTAPAEIEVEIIRPVFRRNSLSRYEQLYGQDQQWLDFEPRARVVVPLKDRRDEEP